jgi:alanine-glyoxylate transaminase/serine-glyoxylate transaminase/serine-pyruvate transaminase
METCFVNLLEPAETAVVLVQGVFGERMCSVVERLGARPVRVEAEMGEIVQTERVAAAIERHRPELVALVHAETSTGVAQPVEEIARVAREAGALVVLDCVTSLSGMNVDVDGWGVDAAYSGTQKCLSCPPGLSPVTFGTRAVERLSRRRTPVQSWYLDLTLIARYFGEERVYHHTAPVSMIYALHEALRRVFDEGLRTRAERHVRAHRHLVEELEGLGFRFLVDPDHRLPMLNTVIPPVEDEADLRRRLLQNHGIEVGGGLGKLASRVWRIGLMGENATTQVVDRLVDALRTEL